MRTGGHSRKSHDRPQNSLHSILFLNPGGPAAEASFNYVDMEHDGFRDATRHRESDTGL